MKRGTPRHPKVDDLAARLALPRYAAAGLLELLWHFAAEFAVAGDVGRFSDDAIARALSWEGDAAKLIDALVAARWLDRCECHRFRVHDWPDHADQTVERVLAKRRQQFLPCYFNASTMLAVDADKTSQPLPLPLPLPLPEPRGPRHSSNDGHPKSQRPTPTSKGRFAPPSIEEVKLEASKIGLPEIEADKFLNHYTANGWKVGGKAAMKSWQPALANWKLRREEHNRNNRPRQSAPPDHSKGFLPCQPPAPPTS